MLRRVAYPGAVRRPGWLWGGFAAVHLWLGFLALRGPGYPLGDVQYVYPGWVATGLGTGEWVGIQTPWVYPVLALVPMVLARALGESAYPIVFLLLAAAAHAAALAVLLGRSPNARRVAIGWGWTGFLLLLGPIAIARIDAFAVALALAGLVVLVRRPRVAALLLTLGAWVKVWPAALVAAVVVTDARRRPVAVVAATLSALIAVVVLILGGNPASFVGAQSGRGLQIESPFATPFMLAAAYGGWSVYYDLTLLTYQLRGPGADEVAAVTTPLLVVVVAALLVVGALAARRGADGTDVLPWLSLALVSAMIAVNKVGSPQFIGWLAAPVAAGLLVRGFRMRGGFGLPAVAALALAALTQVIYPGMYDALVSLQPAMLAVLVLRNALEVALLVGATAGLVRTALSARASAPLPEGAPA